MSNQTDVLKKFLWGSIIIAIFLGICMIVLVSISVKQGFLSPFGCGLLIGGAGLSGGGFLGFIFGIPSILQTPTARLKYNDNLVQISDWLTKVIVGVGLTQLYRIPHAVIKFGVTFQANFGDNIWGRNVAIAITAYFFLLGFLMMYFWTKTDYSTIMKDIDDDLNKQLEDTQQKLDDETKEKMQAQLEKKKAEADLMSVVKEKEQVQEENKEMAKEVVEEKTKASIRQSEVASESSHTGKLEQNIDQPLKDDLDKLKILVDKILPSKKIIVKDDLQKGRWGGKSEKNGKKIKAKVAPNKWQSLFDLTIEICFTNDDPLNTPAAIFVHDSYNLKDNVLYVTPASTGVVQQTLLAYEAFTIGVLLPDGTELEMDLNEEQGFPEKFYWKK